jgi:hypothetical protein
MLILDRTNNSGGQNKNCIFNDYLIQSLKSLKKIVKHMFLKRGLNLHIKVEGFKF